MPKSNLYAAVAGYVGRPDQVGSIGVFARSAGSDEWRHVVQGTESFAVDVHPTDPSVVLAGTGDGVYRSTDGGKTFARTVFPRKTQIWSFLVDRTNPDRIWAGASPVAIFRSEDRGATWIEMPNPGIADRAEAPFQVRVMRMAQHPTKPGTIYGGLEVNGVIRTDDGGQTWTDVSKDLLRLSELPHLKSKIVSNTYAEGMLDSHAIAISPADPDSVILAVRMGLFSTKDRGETWQDMEVGRFSSCTYGRDIRISPQDPNTHYAALSVAAASHEGQVYRTQDGGQTWKRFDKVTVNGTIMSVALHQKDPNQVYLGARYNGEVFGTEDGGETWNAVPLPSGVKDIYCLAVG